ncbi:MAG: HAD-IC family P-type ATPase, partial [Bacilli bacterium]|nr:HAD-IC family P-type ATPase [Bacilli bacterium]
MFNKSKEEVLTLLKSDETKGLTKKEAEDRLSEYGNNELTSKKKVSLFVRFLLQFKDILVIVLLIAALISIVVDPSEWVDSLIILIVVIFNSILGVVQESRAEKSLEALKKMSSPLCKVLRDGSTFQIETKDLVPGDIIMVDAGDYVPADSRIIDSYNLKVDESALTGESVPVDKISSEINKKELAIGDKKNILFSSTFVTYGRGKAIVFNTGMKTEIGKIATLLDSEEQKATPLQNKMEQIGKMMGIV